ncbi:class I lanthipeptide [Chitinophaga sp. 22536]|uniref:class I lanthipeptide n=1 Tax=unclassified Chitinophaga TaxID=2619133 RepID=UPI003F8677ED
MKKKIIKKLSFTKEDITDLSQEEQGYMIGGVAPTFVDPAHGGYCTQVGCGTVTAGPSNCTQGCTGPCPSAAQTGCSPSSTYLDCAHTNLNICFSSVNCTKAECTGQCPATYKDATCGCHS